jgi:uncharacterized protein (DUF1800 family)
VVDSLLEASKGPGTDAHDEWMATAARSGNGNTYVAWWLRRLLESRAVLREKMTLFWHGYFAIGLRATGDLPLFHQHLDTLRGEALGSVPAVLRAEGDDSALWVALDGSANRKAQPNLVFARRWLEAFTLGPEWVSGDLVREVARCFTGWFVYGGRLRWIEREHDPSEKHVLGQAGTFGRDDVLAILADHLATRRMVARRLFRWMISETADPSPALLLPLEEQLGAAAGVLRAVEFVLRSNLFFSEHAVSQKVKSPVELMVGLGRAFDTVLPTQPMAQELVRLGQQLDEPATVCGWTGGPDWINAMTISIRQQWCLATLQGGDGYGAGLDAWRLAVAHACDSPSEAVRRWREVLLSGSFSSEQTGAAESDGTSAEPAHHSVLEAVRGMVVDPRFQIH